MGVGWVDGWVVTEDGGTAVCPLLIDAVTQCGCGGGDGRWLRKWGVLFTLALASQETLMEMKTVSV